MPKSKHATLSASGAARWLACPPSAKLETAFPNASSTYAEEGTAAHTLAELVTRFMLGEQSFSDINTALDECMKGKYYTSEMQECAEAYAEFICGRVDTTRKTCADAVIELEVSGLDFSKWAPGGHGTGDCIIVADGLLEIIDFKYGKGYRVDAADNPQMRLYALGAIERYRQIYDIDRVRTAIIQPRLSQEASSEELSVSELLNWAETYVKPRAKLAHDGTGEFAPSDSACKFCRAKEQCRARAEAVLAAFDDAPDVMLITPEEAGRYYEKADDIRSWLNDLEKLIIKTLYSGEPVEGWKLIEGRSDRVIPDKAKAMETLAAAGIPPDLIYETSLFNLTKLEKGIGRKRVAEILGGLIVKPRGKPALKPASDKRPALIPNELLLAEFGDSDGEPTD